MTNVVASPGVMPVVQSPFLDWMRVLGTLCILLAVVWICLYWMKDHPWFRGTVQKRMKLRIEESRSLGNRSTLHLVTCAEQQFLIASSPAGVSLIADLLPGDNANQLGGAENSTFLSNLAKSSQSSNSPPMS